MNIPFSTTYTQFLRYSTDLRTSTVIGALDLDFDILRTGDDVRDMHPPLVRIKMCVNFDPDNENSHIVCMHL